MLQAAGTQKIRRALPLLEELRKHADRHEGVALIPVDLHSLPAGWDTTHLKEGDLVYLLGQGHGGESLHDLLADAIGFTKVILIQFRHNTRTLLHTHKYTHTNKL
jgi:hypothetical protein